MEERKFYPPSFNPNLPEVHSINGYSLEKEGWVKNGSMYSRDGDTLTYDGVYWKLNNRPVQFMEDLKK